MRRSGVVAAFLTSVLLASGPPAGGEEARRRPPERIISMAPSITETLFELGLGGRVVGVTDYCRFPPETAKIAKVGGYTTPNYEAVAGLRPDLVIVLPEHEEVRRQVASLGVEVLSVDHRSVQGLLDSVRILGDRCGAPERARQLAAELQGVLDRVVRERAGRPRPRVILSIGRSMGHSGVREVHASGPGGVHDDLIRRAGGQNAVPAGPAPYPVLSAEGLLRLDPDVIVEFAPDAGDPEAIKREWLALPSLRAVREKRVLVFTEGFVAVPGPRLLRFVETIARAFDTAAPKP